MSEPSRGSSTFFLAVRSFVYAAGFVLLWAFVAASARRFDDRFGGELPSWLAPVGWTLGAAGALLALTCIALFVIEGRGTPAIFDSPREFVATGPYRYVRNPMYVGGLLALLGTGLILGSPAILLVAVSFALLAHGVVLLHEEPRLERLFGPSYLGYKRKVNRWIPRRPSRREGSGMRN